ncbi:MAG TPA: hypothetical protein PLT41_12885 [Thermoanaerobaculia bacterium]|nr:hypothetical protein [Thermoanaerobaculia bacterium]
MSSLRLVPEPRPLAPVIPIAGRTPSGALAREIARLAAERRLAARPSERPRPTPPPAPPTTPGAA